MKFVRAVCAAAIISGLSCQAWAQNTDSGMLPILTLNEAIERVLKVAPLVNASEEAINAAEGTMRQAKTRPNPELSIEGANLGGSGTYEGLDRAEFTLSMAQKIERGGKRDARVDLAKSEGDMAQLSASVTKQDVILETRQAYIEAMAAAAALVNAKDRANVARELKAAVDKRVKSARDSGAAAQRFGALALEAQTDLAQAQFSLDRAKQALSALWGGYETNFRIDQKSLFSMSLGDQPDLKAGVKETPDIRLAESMVNRSAAAVSLEQSNAKQDPEVALGVRQYQQTDDVAAVVTLSIPLAFFDTNRGNIERAKANKRQSEWMAQDAQMRFERSLQSNAAILRAAYAEVLAFRNNIIPTATVALKETRAGYDRGAFTYLEVLEAQRALQDYQAREIAALKRFHLTKAMIDRLTAEYQVPSMHQGEVQ